MALHSKPKHHGAPAVVTPDRSVSSHNASNHPGSAMVPPPEPGRTGSRAKNGLPITRMDLENHVREQQAALVKQINATIKQEINKAVGSGLRKTLQEAISKAVNGPETRKEIIDLVKEETKADEGRGSMLTDEALEEKVNEAVKKATSAIQVTPGPPESATKLARGLFSSIAEMKTDRGSKTVQHCITR